MQRLSLVDETFDLNYTLEYILSIQISLDGFSFSILDSVQNKVIYLYSQGLFEAEPEFLLKRLQAIYDDVDLLNLPYKKVKIFYLNPGRTTLVPDELFDEDKCQDYIKAAFQPQDKRLIKHSHHKSIKYWSVFELPEILAKFLEEKYPKAQLVTDLDLTIPTELNPQRILKILVLKKHLVLTGIDEFGLNFYNCFYYDGENDVLYYVLGSIKNMEAEPEQILLSGEVNKYSTIYHRLKQYCTNVEIETNPKQIHYSYLFDKLPDARFVNLFKSFTCA